MDESDEIQAIEPQDTELYGRLSPDLQGAVIEVRKVVETRLKKVEGPLFYHYTAHDIRHVLRTLTGFCLILKNSRVTITDEQALICLCACLVHDIGMGPITKEEEIWVYKNAGNREDPSVAQKIREWREDHHERTMKWVLADDLFSFTDGTTGLREAIAQVARGHREVPLLSDGYFTSHQEDAFLAAVLRLGDQMDLSPKRLDERFDMTDPEPYMRELINSAVSEKEKNKFEKP